MSEAIRRAYVVDPPSQRIADALNAAGAAGCEHGRNPCILRCGVAGRPALVNGSFVGPMKWEPIHPLARQRWLENQLDDDDSPWRGLCDDPRHGFRYLCGCRKETK